MDSLTELLHVIVSFLAGGFISMMFYWPIGCREFYFSVGAFLVCLFFSKL